MAGDGAPLQAPGGIDTRLAAEVSRRRTFAIISHPDAGKTTLTEKLLLYGGAIQLAGAVRGRKTQRHAVSDWMDVERERGISVTSAALEFDLGNCHVTLLDTPGHQDFSEDTYRTLSAVDSAVMVIDAAKGIEAQTRKLFEVCRLRHMPIFTFVNKLDLPGRDPFELLRGDRGGARHPRRAAELADRQRRPLPRRVRPGHAGDAALRAGARRRLPGAGAHHRRRRSACWSSCSARTLHAGAARRHRRSSPGAGTPFDAAEYLAGRQTPVYFGSALDNFGVEALLEALETLAPPPQPRRRPTAAWCRRWRRASRASSSRSRRT